ncbi:MAG: TatD family hydrolase [Alphaproteobacteria bacterium]|nr:TatD family deoxyribonuclease [Bacteroidales bacterium]MBQ2887027.1 TatD family hydrolase [Alphaproteobacteria bacterium]
MIDTHCHFDIMSNPEAYIYAKEVVGDIVIGMTNLPSHFCIGEPHLRSFKHVRLALGLHPLLAADKQNELQIFKNNIEKTSYIGEIGLDFSKSGISTKEIQISVLRKILSELKGKKKIVSVHSRKAERELLDLLCEYDIKNVIFHWYSGPIGLIPSILSCGYYFSVNESMTLSKNGQKIIENIPKSRILTETDAPYNSKTDIVKVLTYLRMTEQDIKNNFMELICKIK